MRERSLGRDAVRGIWIAGVAALLAIAVVAIPALLRGAPGSGMTLADTASLRSEVAAWVRNAPSSSAGKVAILGPSVRMKVACVVRGESVTFGDKTSDLWGYLWSPVEGFISDALLDTSSNGPAVRACSDPPSRPPSSPPLIGKLVELPAASTVIRTGASPASGTVIVLEANSWVMVDCWINGDTASTGGSSSTAWARTVQPFSGYVSELAISGGLEEVPAC